MINLIIKLVKKVIFGFLFIYAYNCFPMPSLLNIPFNLYTISFVSLFGIPGVFLIVLYSLVCL